jgi:acylphosphatase
MESRSEAARVHLVIRGRVQGVYYRASMLHEAQKLGLTGWVRNCPDGSVEAVAEGSRNHLEKLISWCWKGPPGARVSRIDPLWHPAQHSEVDFSVKRQ